MKQTALKIINNLNDTVLTVVFVFIVVFSVIVAGSIQARPLNNTVLGINDSTKFFTPLFDINQKSYSVNYYDDDFSLLFKISIDLKGEDILSIPLGKINTKLIKQGGLYRSVLNISDIYKNDVDVLLMIDEKPYGLLLNGVFYQNNFRSSDDQDSNISLKIQSKKSIYYKIPLEFTVYK